MKKYYFFTAIVVAGFLASIQSLRYLKHPYVWVFLSLAILFALGAALRFNSTTKILCIFLALVFFTLSAFEAYLGMDAKEPTNLILTKGYRKSDDVLGYRRPKNFQAKARNMRGSEAIFDVIYTTDSNGLRISPPFKKRENQPCILFFGGSFTFGAGVNDEETMPYRVGVRAGENFRIYNFGDAGYGPHQMLSAIEHGLVEKEAPCSPTHIFFQTIREHIMRSAGRAPWDPHGPRYIVGKQGKAVYSGNFDTDSLLPPRLTRLFHKSFIYTKIFGYQRAISRDEIILYQAIVNKARNLLKGLYPQASFQVIYWDSKDRPDIDKKLIDGFKRNQIPVHLISNILPEIHDHQSLYRLSPYDDHPTPQAHDMIAQYIVENILIETP